MKVALLDRDGTLIVDPPDERVKSVKDIKLFPDSLSALKKLADNGFAVILITSQAGIAEGLITEHEFYLINKEVAHRLEASGVKVLKTYMCPHGKSDGCGCRKPKTGLFLRAAKEYGLDLEDAFYAGDRHSDVKAGKNAGTRTILVRTATNKQEEAPEADFQAQNLTEAVEQIIANS